MSSGNNTDSGNNSNSADKVDWQCVATPNLIEQVKDSLEVQIVKFDEQSHHRHDKLMKWVAEQEAQRKAEEERKKAKEEAKRVAEEEVRRLAEEDAQKRAEFQVRWQADLERKAREKAEAKVASEAMKVCIAQRVAQGKKPKPKICGMELFSSLLLLTYSLNFSNIGRPVSVHPARRSRGDIPHVTGAGGAVKCHFKVSTATMKRLASGEKCKESEMSATVVMMLLRGGEKRKRTRSVVANTVSTKEIEEALGGFSVVGPSTWPDPVTQVLDWRLRKVIVAIDRNTRELV
ncbi:hypothetical protein SCLCIDRAFT_21266 [Scleroderma citrinum Foug A]|uniref:Uncharacterized protein n=1 Tax=Scleroderma citrinum Foug A TaxID=1036808 RepID=A0A0C3EHH9_9AGAM|nr:hypothetical protein SCLCIDRAFT_21266 [Scleroderma citrinum Foug A]